MSILLLFYSSEVFSAMVVLAPAPKFLRTENRLLATLFTPF
jgi:hypothetical protein